MSWVVAVSVASLIGVPVSVTGILLQLKAHGRATAQRLEDMKSLLRAEGKAAMQPTIDLLKSQRDDARRERDEAKREADEWRSTYLDLINGRRPRPGGS